MSYKEKYLKYKKKYIDLKKQSIIKGGKPIYFNNKVNPNIYYVDLSDLSDKSHITFINENFCKKLYKFKIYEFITSIKYHIYSSTFYV
jgi:hypothetical protein